MNISVSITGGSFGVSLASGTDPASITVGDVSEALSTGGNATVRANDITATGADVGTASITITAMPSSLPTTLDRGHRRRRIRVKF